MRSTRAAELHDIGKIAIPDSVLNKPGPLDATEWELMRSHTLIGERILGAAPALRPVAKLVRSTHERWDGGGYPDGLAGEEIPLGARIIFICDAFDVMTSDARVSALAVGGRGARRAAPKRRHAVRSADRRGLLPSRRAWTPAVDSDDNVVRRPTTFGQRPAPVPSPP